MWITRQRGYMCSVRPTCPLHVQLLGGMPLWQHVDSFVYRLNTRFFGRNDSSARKNSPEPDTPHIWDRSFVRQKMCMIFVSRRRRSFPPKYTLLHRGHPTYPQ